MPNDNCTGISGLTDNFYIAGQEYSYDADLDQYSEVGS